MQGGQPGGFQLGGSSGGFQLGGGLGGGLQLGGGVKLPGQASTQQPSGGLQLGGLGGSVGTQSGGLALGNQSGGLALGNQSGGLALGNQSGGLALGNQSGGLALGNQSGGLAGIGIGLKLGQTGESGGGGLQLGGAQLGGGSGVQLGAGLKLSQPPTQTATAAGGLQSQQLSIGHGGPTSVGGGLKILPPYSAATQGIWPGASSTQSTIIGKPLGSGLGGLGQLSAVSQQLKPGSLGTPSLGMNPSLKPSAGQKASLSGLTTTTPSASATGKKYTYKELENLVNKWSHELQDQEKVFIQQAAQVNKWDRVLTDNAEKVVELNNDVDRVKNEQKRVDNELDWIRTQQDELDNLLTQLESKVDDGPAQSSHADIQRTKTFRMSENIDTQLKLMAQDLKKIIEHMNEANSTPDEDNPFTQIVKILNAHTDSLGWIDHEAALLRKKVEDVKTVTSYRRREQEMSFR